MRRAGSLTIVGTGIRLAGHVTLEALDHIKRADRVLYLVGDPATADWLQRLNPTAETLHDSYREGRPRTDTYREMTERILRPVRDHRRVVAAFYGHPGVGVDPAYAALRRARREGFPARMLPGLSAEACLIADLEVDPLESGWQAYEAWAYIVNRPQVEQRAALVLWQLGLIFQPSIDPSGRPNPGALTALAEALREVYPARHAGVLYEASPFPACESRIERIALQNLPKAVIRTSTTLYVPPVRTRTTSSRTRLKSRSL